MEKTPNGVFLNLLLDNAGYAIGTKLTVEMYWDYPVHLYDTRGKPEGGTKQKHSPPQPEAHEVENDEGYNLRLMRDS